MHSERLRGRKSPMAAHRQRNHRDTARGCTVPWLVCWEWLEGAVAMEPYLCCLNHPWVLDLRLRGRLPVASAAYNHRTHRGKGGEMTGEEEEYSCPQVQGERHTRLNLTNLEQLYNTCCSYRTSVKPALRGRYASVGMMSSMRCPPTTGRFLNGCGFPLIASYQSPNGTSRQTGHCRHLEGKRVVSVQQRRWRTDDAPDMM